MNNNNVTIIDKLLKSLDGFEEAWAAEFTRRVTAKTPVSHDKYDKHSGALKAGWKMALNGTDMELSNEEDYAVYVEVGTIHTPPVGMIRTTVMEEPEITQMAKTKVGI